MRSSVSAICLLVALLTPSAHAGSSTPSLRQLEIFNATSDSSTASESPAAPHADNEVCDYFECRPRSTAVSSADCQLWCNYNGAGVTTSALAAVSCGAYCKCAQNAVANGGLICSGVCLPKPMCFGSRVAKCTIRTLTCARQASS